MDEIGIEQARNQLGEIVDRARLAGQPTMLTRKGKPAAIVVGADWYRKTTAAAAAGETFEPLDGIVRLTVSTDSDVAFGLLEEAYRRAGRPEGGGDAGRERLEAMKDIMADALREYLDRRDLAAPGTTTETTGEQQR